MEITAADIESELAQLRDLPTQVSGWIVETGLDASDEPAVWVWALLEEEEVEFEIRSRLRGLVRERVRNRTGPSVWVYVRFRGASEKVPA